MIVDAYSLTITFLTVLIPLVAWLIKICVTKIILKFYRNKHIEQDVILITGCCFSGKTSLFYKLQDENFSSLLTVSSCKLNVFTFTKCSLSEKSPLCHIEWKPYQKKWNLVDFPGHTRFHYELPQWFSKACCIIFMIDASNKTAIKTSATQLYNIFFSRTLLKNKTPVIIVCNKTDLLTTKTKKEVSSDLFREIEKIRVAQECAFQENNDSFTKIDTPAHPILSVDDVDLPVHFCSSSVDTNRLSHILEAIQTVIFGSLKSDINKSA
ncbi:signal recognition particle receptor subunit beta-like [Hylaeus volcanicus]|uniref:signal recognition particle receptor subunit beta-like n=1 Tax=Hylaeus volcanicus TaxID=313075 RepID=UPI0023B8244D|nr:signal recognition particle receptor subunit beta-like [Hylaeus volcanicus]XP_053993237.1 signal recognition particle receptor subunit beta-like [Hylaeus volcanicus]